jgi:hypothetical protein
VAFKTHTHTHTQNHSQAGKNNKKQGVTPFSLEKHLLFSNNTWLCLELSLFTKRNICKIILWSKNRGVKEKHPKLKSGVCERGSPGGRKAVSRVS